MDDNQLTKNGGVTQTYANTNYKNNLKKIILILIFIFAAFFVIKTLYQNYLYSKSIENYNRDLINSFNPFLSSFFGEKRNLSSVEETKAYLTKAKEQMLENYYLIKSNKTAFFYLGYENCTKNGTTREILIDFQKERKWCYENGNYVCNCTREFKKNTSSENLREYMPFYFYTRSISILMYEGVFDIDEVLKSKGKKDISNIDLATLSIVRHTYINAVVNAELMPIIMFSENVKDEYYVNWSANIQDKLLKLESFANKIPEVTEDQINKINFEKMCVDFLKDQKNVEKKLVGRYSNYDKLCRSFDKYEKTRLIKMLERSRNEKLPFLKIYQKYYLARVVECQDEGFATTSSKEISEDKKCKYNDKIMKLYKEEFGL